MKGVRTLLCCLAMFAGVVSAQPVPVPTPDPGYTPGGPDDPNQNIRKLVQYLINLGSYLGYDLTQSPSNTSQALLNLSGASLIQQYLYNASLGATPVNTLLNTGNLSNIFVPAGVQIGSYINDWASKTYTSPSYTSGGSIGTNPLLDQSNPQPDPVNQAILNILGTPDDTYCMDQPEQNWSGNCNFLFQSKVVANVIGPTPGLNDYFSFAFNQGILPQLNSNSLTGPLLYTMQGQGSPQGSAGASPTSASQQQNKVLNAQDEAQLAANFIRYATGSVVPVDLPKRSEYYNYWKDLFNKNLTDVQKARSQSVIINYLASLRVYAAQMSVGYSNLYYILAKRMPQNQGGNSSTNTSQALSEFNMASWRLFNPNSNQQQQNTQWINQINNASSATVQKEIAILLAEINYQLYLSRQQEERILLTNSMLLMQNARAEQPSLESASANAVSSTAPTSGGGQ